MVCSLLKAMRLNSCLSSTSFTLSNFPSERSVTLATPCSLHHCNYDVICLDFSPKSKTLTLATPHLCAPCSSMYSMKRGKSRNSSMVGVKHITPPSSHLQAISHELSITETLIGVWCWQLTSQGTFDTTATSLLFKTTAYCQWLCTILRLANYDVKVVTGRPRLVVPRTRLRTYAKLRIT